MKTLTVWKYMVPKDGAFVLEVPIGAKVLCAQRWKEVPALWMQVDPDAKKEKRNFVMLGTGHELNFEGELVYIHTFQFMGGDRVSHLFEVVAGGQVLQLVPKEQPKDMN